MHNSRRLGNRPDGARLIVDHHDRYQNRVRPDHVRQLFRRYPPVTVHAQTGNLKSVLPQKLQGRMHGCVFRLRRDNMLPCSHVRKCGSGQGHIICLGPARRKNNLFPAHLQRLRDLFPGPADRVLRPLSHIVQGRRIAVFFREHFYHPLHGPLTAPGRGRIIQIYFHFSSNHTGAAGSPSEPQRSGSP